VLPIAGLAGEVEVKVIVWVLDDPLLPVPPVPDPPLPDCDPRVGKVHENETAPAPPLSKPARPGS